MPTGPEAQGTYLINIQGVKDLAGNLVSTSDRPDPAPGGYSAIETSIVGKIAPGYRIYFRTLELPVTPNSVTESFGNNVAEETSSLFTFSTAGSAAGNLTNPIPTSPAAGGAGFTLIQTQPGQATTGNWNDAYRFLGTTGSGRPNVHANTALDDGSGRLKATYAPYMGNGDDLSFNLASGNTSLRTDGQDDFNNDGVFEFDRLLPRLDGHAHVHGHAAGVDPRPRLLHDQRHDSLQRREGPLRHRHRRHGEVHGAGAIEPSGVGGLGGPGGGDGGRGAPGLVLPNAGDAISGAAGLNVLGDAVVTGVGGFGTFGDLTGATRTRAAAAAATPPAARAAPGRTARPPAWPTSPARSRASRRSAASSRAETSRAARAAAAAASTTTTAPPRRATRRSPSPVPARRSSRAVTTPAAAAAAAAARSGSSRT